MCVYFWALQHRCSLSVTCSGLVSRLHLKSLSIYCLFGHIPNCCFVERWAKPLLFVLSPRIILTQEAQPTHHSSRSTTSEINNLSSTSLFTFHDDFIPFLTCSLASIHSLNSCFFVVYSTSFAFAMIFKVPRPKTKASFSKLTNNSHKNGWHTVFGVVTSSTSGEAKQQAEIHSCWG